MGTSEQGLLSEAKLPKVTTVGKVKKKKSTLSFVICTVYAKTLAKSVYVVRRTKKLKAG